MVFFHSCGAGQMLILQWLFFQYYFEGRYDIVKFAKLVGYHGLYLHLRIGPYVCAEWNFGSQPHHHYSYCAVLLVFQFIALKVNTPLNNSYNIILLCNLKD